MLSENVFRHLCWRRTGMSPLCRSDPVGCAQRRPMASAACRPMAIGIAVYKRFARWCAQASGNNCLNPLRTTPTCEWLLLDSTIVRAHPCAAGALKKTVDKPSKPWDAVAAASAPRFISLWTAWAIRCALRLTAGQTHDGTQARSLVGWDRCRSRCHCRSGFDAASLGRLD